jgi:hypothetical protein
VKAKKKAKRKQRRALDKKPAFLAAFKVCCDLTASAEAIGIDRGQHYDWLKSDPKYAATFAEAKAEAIQSLHDRAVNRVMVGDFVPNVYQGRFCYPQEEYVLIPGKPAVEAVAALDWKEEGGPREAVEAVPEVKEVRAWRDVPGSRPLGTYRKSEMLHAQLLRAHIPAFRSSTVEVTGAGGGPVELSIVERLNAARNRLAAAKNAPEQKQS